MKGELETWTTPLGERLTVAGKGGPWMPITNHIAAPQPLETPLDLPIPHGVDKGWYYRGGWQPPKGDA